MLKVSRQPYLSRALLMLLASIVAGAASALPIGYMPPTPLLLAGVPPDSPGDRVDANLSTSPFSGVVSIFIRYGTESFICSGTLVSRRHVVTAAHCLDTSGNGSIVDITRAGNDVQAVFNSEPNPGDPGRAIITASAVSMHPDYQGLGNCPAGVSGFCYNDDIAVVTLNQDAPASAVAYSAYIGSVAAGQLISLVGYGVSGTGTTGATTSPDFRIKRTGLNIMDWFDLNDEQNFAGPAEVWYADFDGGGRGYPLPCLWCVHSHTSEQ